jgi:hypothetical protein
MISCDISASDILVDRGVVSCGATNASSSSFMTVTGTTTTHTLQILNSSLTIRLLTVSITNMNPFMARNSQITIITDGRSDLTSVGPNPAISCAANSSLTFISTQDGILSTRSGTSSAVIGPGPNQQCQSLSFLNGTYRISSENAGAGIGSGNSSILTRLYVRNGHFSVTSNLGPCIGAVSSSQLAEIAIINGVFELNNSGYAPAIGSSLWSSIGRIEIDAGEFDIRTQFGPGLGSGGGDATVSDITIYGGAFRIRSDQGPGIGRYFEGSVANSIVIDSASISVRTGGRFGIDSSAYFTLGSISLECFASELCVSAVFVSLIGPDVNIVTNASIFDPRALFERPPSQMFLYGQYLNRSEQERSISFPSIQIGRLSGIEARPAAIRIRQTDPRTGFDKGVVLGEESGGLIVSVNSPGRFEMAVGESALCHGSGGFFEVDQGLSYFDQVQMCSGSDSSGAGTHTALIAGSIAAGVVGLAAVAGLLLFVCRRKHSLLSEVVKSRALLDSAEAPER